MSTAGPNEKNEKGINGLWDPASNNNLPIKIVNFMVHFLDKIHPVLTCKMVP